MSSDDDEISDFAGFPLPQTPTGQWYFKKNAQLPDDNPDAWEPYAETINKLMDLRYQGGMKTHTFNAKQRVNFLQMVEEDINNIANRVPIKRIEPDLNFDDNNEDEAQLKKRKVAENKINFNTEKKMRTEGKAKIYNLSDSEPASWVMSKEIRWGNSIPLSKIPNFPPHIDLQYGDLVYFFPERGIGLFVVDIRNGEIYLVKTLDEYGYVLPPPFRNWPRNYYEHDDTIAFGFSCDDDEKLYDEQNEEQEEEEEEEQEENY